MHTRLSIIDIETGQPMKTENVHLVFNGEIYNYLELKKELEAKGFKFKTQSDTEAILASYVHYGENFVAKVRNVCYSNL